VAYPLVVSKPETAESPSPFVVRRPEAAIGEVIVPFVVRSH
jgi:hypothetical protein